MVCDGNHLGTFLICVLQGPYLLLKSGLCYNLIEKTLEIERKRRIHILERVIFHVTEMKEWETIRPSLQYPQNSI
ncbi:hypothetical protein HMPREF0061_1262 [Aerococcus viridans ATCC 11563 = CCUG 4311]|uniref:Uncharacterized protein n=1 Tax=Aerococcus viridans (strain ATCC 11563 / DSM 20340 / CCUG 4311 / JCM 20461 / NBRC 12219 / NCTC 8251 / M1) TaxID=655812 RepID=A0ABP2IB61_AERVM|nr:hypothetical protein HMPREF0061_1262 [Aerococcus viridans ATCC 11563 = CCUG 4311]